MPRTRLLDTAAARTLIVEYKDRLSYLRLYIALQLGKTA